MKAAAPRAAAERAAPGSEKVVFDGPDGSAAGAKGGAATGAPPVEGVARKLIYTAELRLSVKDIDATREAVAAAVAEHKGFLASQEIAGTPGSFRNGRWKVRVPTERFDQLLAALALLGEVERNSTDSKDVTEEYYDVEARLKNKKIEEDRLLKHLEKSTGTLKDTLDVERELSRVRGEIEQLQGRLNLLANLTTLATINLYARERTTYVPVKSTQAPAFGDDVSSTFTESVSLLKDTGRNVALFFVALTPWLPFLAVGLGLLWFLSRRALRRLRALRAVPTLEAVPAVER
jgi:hypothetical protein